MSDISKFDWASELPSAVTITNKDGIIVYMNNKSVDTFANDGGSGLIGQNLYDCHNEHSNHIIQNITDSKLPNIYTIEKKGIKKLIYQCTSGIAPSPCTETRDLIPPNTSVFSPVIKS